MGPVVRLLDRSALGKRIDAICQIRMKAQDRESRVEFESFIERQEEVLECLSMSGEWDYQLRIVADDVEEYEHFLMHRLLGHKCVATSASQFVLRRIKHTTALPV